MATILLTGACGQLGSELTARLRSIYGRENVIASDIRHPDSDAADGCFEYVDVLNKQELAGIIDDYEVTHIYHLAALLSAKSEQHITQAWKLNVEGLLNVLNLAREKSLKQVFWPSSIAVFGPDTRGHNASQQAALH